MKVFVSHQTPYYAGEYLAIKGKSSDNTCSAHPETVIVLFHGLHNENYYGYEFSRSGWVLCDVISGALFVKDSISPQILYCNVTTRSIWKMFSVTTKRALYRFARHRFRKLKLQLRKMLFGGTALKPLQDCKIINVQASVIFFEIHKSSAEAMGLRSDPACIHSDIFFVFRRLHFRDCIT